MPLAHLLLHRLGLLGLGLVVALHLYVLYVPQAPGESPFPHSDKAIHVIVFAAPVFLAISLGFAQRWVAAVGAGHAVVSEMVQHVALPDRSGDIWDVAADLVGVGLGVLCARVVHGWLMRREVSRAARGVTEQS